MADTPALSVSEPSPSPGRAPFRLSFMHIALLAGLIAYAAVLAGVWWAALRFTPDQISVTVSGHALHMSEVHRKLVSNAMMLFAILPFALWVEWMSVGWENSSIRRLVLARTASSQTDLVILILGQVRVLDVMAKLMLLGVSFISGEAIRLWLKAHTGLYVDPAGLPFLVQLPLFFAVYTFLDYWTHRLDHWKYFWPLHRYHHAAEEFVVVTSERQHPAQFAGVFVINVPLAILGADPAVMLYVNVLVSTIGLIIHSRIDSDWDWFGRWVIQSPNHHRLHHKLDMAHPTGHFAIAPVWDHLFGTFYGARGGYDPSPSLPIGVDRPYRHGFWVVPDLLRDYWDFWRGFFLRGKTHL